MPCRRPATRQVTKSGPFVCPPVITPADKDMSVMSARRARTFPRPGGSHGSARRLSWLCSNACGKQRYGAGIGAREKVDFGPPNPMAMRMGSARPLAGKVTAQRRRKNESVDMQWAIYGKANVFAQSRSPSLPHQGLGPRNAEHLPVICPSWACSVRPKFLFLEGFPSYT